MTEAPSRKENNEAGGDVHQNIVGGATAGQADAQLPGFAIRSNPQKHFACVVGYDSSRMCARFSICGTCGQTQ